MGVYCSLATAVKIQLTITSKGNPVRQICRHNLAAVGQKKRRGEKRRKGRKWKRKERGRKKGKGKKKKKSEKDRKEREKWEKGRKGGRKKRKKRIKKKMEDWCCRPNIIVTQAQIVRAGTFNYNKRKQSDTLSVTCVSILLSILDSEALSIQARFFRAKTNLCVGIVNKGKVIMKVTKPFLFRHIITHERNPKSLFCFTQLANICVGTVYCTGLMGWVRPVVRPIALFASRVKYKAQLSGAGNIQFK